MVVLSEVANNPGASVTNAAEYLAEQVRARFLGGRDAIFVEHYPVAIGGHDEDTYDQVTFEQDFSGRYCKPTWKHLGMAGFKALVEANERGL